MPKRKRKSIKNVKPVDPLSQVKANAAGLDIGAEEIYVCVPADRDEQAVRVFGTFTVDLNALADWLTTCGVETVAMESTSVGVLSITSSAGATARPEMPVQESAT